MYCSIRIACPEVNCRKVAKEIVPAEKVSHQHKPKKHPKLTGKKQNKTKIACESLVEYVFPETLDISEQKENWNWDAGLLPGVSHQVLRNINTKTAPPEFV